MAFSSTWRILHYMRMSDVIRRGTPLLVIFMSTHAVIACVERKRLAKRLSLR